MDRSLPRSTVIDAPPARVFALLADPRRHSEFDGLGTVKGRLRGPATLTLGRQPAMPGATVRRSATRAISR
jgi:uncharacterized protein YndB with AHSA1/START domain